MSYSYVFFSGKTRRSVNAKSVAIASAAAHPRHNVIEILDDSDDAGLLDATRRQRANPTAVPAKVVTGKRKRSELGTAIIGPDRLQASSPKRRGFAKDCEETPTADPFHSAPEHMARIAGKQCLGQLFSPWQHRSDPQRRGTLAWHAADLRSTRARLAGPAIPADSHVATVLGILCAPDADASTQLCVLFGWIRDELFNDVPFYDAIETCDLARDNYDDEHSDEDDDECLNIQSAFALCYPLCYRATIDPARMRNTEMLAEAFWVLERLALAVGMGSVRPVEGIEGEQCQLMRLRLGLVAITKRAVTGIEWACELPSAPLAKGAVRAAKIYVDAVKARIDSVERAYMGFARASELADGSDPLQALSVACSFVLDWRTTTVSKG